MGETLERHPFSGLVHSAGEPASPVLLTRSGPQKSILIDEESGD